MGTGCRRGFEEDRRQGLAKKSKEENKWQDAIKEGL
jgi:hypothetical protein